MNEALIVAELELIMNVFLSLPNMPRAFMKACQFDWLAGTATGGSIT